MLLEGKSIVVMGARVGSRPRLGAALRRGGRQGRRRRRRPRPRQGTVQLIEDAGGTAIADQCDVSKEADVDATIALAVSSFGRLDIIFNNVGRPDAAARA